jgi:DNA-binding transcriptional LysR family regulator
LAGVAGIFALITLLYSRKFKRQFHSDNSLDINFNWKTAAHIFLGGGALAIVLSIVIFYGDKTLDFLMIVSILYLAFFIKHVFLVPQDQRKNMMIIFFGIIAVALSGALIGHGETVFTLLMTRNVDLHISDFEVPITFIQAVDPITIVLLGPLFALLWRYVSKRGYHISGVIKTLAGFGIIVLAYLNLYFLCGNVDDNQLIPVIPLIIGISFMATSDILIYPNVLTLCSKFAPKGLTGVIMGFIVFGMYLSKILGTYLARLASVDNSKTELDLSYSLFVYKDFFSSMALISFVTLIVLSCFIFLILKKRKSMDLNKLKIFHAVAKFGALNLASAELQMRTSTISVSISNFEKEIKCKLFRRHYRGMELTLEGEKLYRSSKLIFDECEFALKELSKENENIRKVLRISTSWGIASSNWFVQNISRFIEKHPDILIRLLDYRSSEVDYIETDIFICPYIYDKPNLIQREVKKFCFRMFASESYISKFGKPEKIEDLDNHRLISFTRELLNPFSNVDSIINIGRENQNPRDVVIEVNSNICLLKLIKNGVGIGVISIESEVESELVPILESNELILPTYISYEKKYKDQDIVKTFSSYFFD